MKLTKLELSGFKSFADTLTLEFESGVTAVVGPNGCGKSNISDAVRWVLGEQSARLLRGGKMEDVIFQGSARRRPVNLTEVSLYLDNSDGTLPIAYQEVVVTRRLSRSGNSDYLLNNAPVRLRDIQDLLRGTGMGSDSGVVIEAKMIDLLLSDRADERRTLFEEAAGIGLYRDRKHATERRLEETATDLQRLDDLLSEVQSQIRSLARQKGKTERHAKLTEERFLLQVTLAQRMLDHLTEQAQGLATRHAELEKELPQLRTELGTRSKEHEALARSRSGAENHRAGIAKSLADAQVALAKLEADIAIASERLTAATARRVRVEEERALLDQRGELARQEGESAGTEREDTERHYTQISQELASHTTREATARERLNTHRMDVKRLEETLQAQLQMIRSLDGERSALDTELASLRERADVAAGHLEAQRNDLTVAAARHQEASSATEARAREAQEAASTAERLRHLLAETREHEASDRVVFRQTQETLAQLSARRHALEELERDRVGLAPAAAALLEVRDQFDGGILGPLSDFLKTDGESAELAERLLGDWVHAVLVRDWATMERIRAWHESAEPGALVLLPVNPGPSQHAPSGHPLTGRLEAEPVAAAWVEALVGGSEALEMTGRALRRASGAVYLSGVASPSGPLRRRAELVDLVAAVSSQETTLEDIRQRLDATRKRLAGLESEVEQASDRVAKSAEAEREAAGVREDAARLVAALTREASDAELQLTRIQERIVQAERRLAEVDEGLATGDLTRGATEEALRDAREQLAGAEHEVESTREARLHWQVQDAHTSARLQALVERATRASRTLEETAHATQDLTAERDRLSQEIVHLESQQAAWETQLDERQMAVQALALATAEAEESLRQQEEALQTSEGAVADLRASVELLTEEHHRLELELADVSASRRSIRERVETEWHAPLESLLERVEPLDLDLETLEAESARINQSLEAMGPVNPLAMEEHAEEVKRLEFLTGQRDDLVAARQSLLQAIREIDGTAKALFLETFAAIQTNFEKVFQTLFGGGECQLRLGDPDDPLESEIEISAAPRGKRTQRIHLLSTGERTLVAVSLLFSIYLTKPSPFCLMDEVDAPLDDSNVGRFTTLLEQFKDETQFVVITHNPRTMQAADAVYGVTMQEPGVSTIVGVRLGPSAPVPA